MPNLFDGLLGEAISFRVTLLLVAVARTLRSLTSPVFKRPSHPPFAGCAGCPFTITGQPAARAGAGSPQRWKKRVGNSTHQRRQRARRDVEQGANRTAAAARDLAARGHGGCLDARLSQCNPLRGACPVVRPRSPIRRASGSPVSAVPWAVITSATRSISTAMARNSLA